MHCSIIIFFKESCLELEHMLITEGTEHSSRHTSTDFVIFWLPHKPRITKLYCPAVYSDGLWILQEESMF